MTMLSFELGFKTDTLNNLDLPVEIRKPNMVLVKRTSASKTVEVSPGTYYVNFKMPAGQEAWSKVDVEGESARVVLSPDDKEDESLSDVSSDESLPDVSEVQHYFMPRHIPPPRNLSNKSRILAGALGGIVGAGLGYSFAEGKMWVIAAAAGASLSPILLSKALEPGLALIKRKTAEARLRKFTGNVLMGKYSTDTEWRPELLKIGDCSGQLTIRGENSGQIIQLLQSGAPAVNVLLPAWEENLCTVVLTKLPEGRYSMDFHLQNTAADLLLGYWQQGLWQNAASVTDSAAVSAEELLYQKRLHPIAASVGAYSLLRFGALDRLHNWTENLMNWFSWLPDGLAIRGEHLARLGEHSEALRVLCRLTERGLPYFSDGLSYTVDRLRLYLGTSEKRFEDDDLQTARETLRLLEPFAAVTDFRKPLLTFTGLDPGKPDSKPLGRKLSSYGGLDLLRQSSWSGAATDKRPAATI